jgi:putative transposase
MLPSVALFISQNNDMGHHAWRMNFAPGGQTFNIKTVAASLRRQGLRAKASRRFIPVNYRAHALPVSENLLRQDFCASGPNQKWSGDITYCVPGVQGGHGCSNEPRVCLEY